MKPIKTGIVLSVTIVLFYISCTLVWVALPEPFMNFVNSLFHGLDFRRLQTGEPFSWWDTAYPAIVFAIWFFAVGVFFAWLGNKVGNED